MQRNNKNNNSNKKMMIAIVYATQGGMGDVGKFALTLAKAKAGSESESDASFLSLCDIKPVAVSFMEEDGTTSNNHNHTQDHPHLEVDVEDLEFKKQTETILGTLEDTIIKINIADTTAEEDLGTAMDGADAVISCLGNRQPGMKRWCAVGTHKVINAMKSKKISRLVCLSSFGIGQNDGMTPSPITILWAILLRTMLRSARTDLQRLEEVVRTSDLDYVLVRPVGLTPSESPRGFCDQLFSNKDQDPNNKNPNKKQRLKLTCMMSKVDAARFMLNEVINPSIHQKEVTIGYSTTSRARRRP